MMDACTPSLPEVAATLHARFAGHALLRQAETGVPLRRRALVVLPDMSTRCGGLTVVVECLTGIDPAWVIFDMAEVSQRHARMLWDSPPCRSHSIPGMIDVTPRMGTAEPVSRGPGHDLGAIITRLLDAEPALAEASDGGCICPTCEGECMVPDCTDPACGCEIDPPCREVACPTCGGIGSV